MRLQIDADQARRFLSALDPDETVFVFQTFDDDSSRKSRQLSRKIVGTLDQALPVLNQVQAGGGGVFVQVQGGRGRGQEHLTHGRALYVDADEPDQVPEIIEHLKQSLPAPTVVVQSSEVGKYHLYWMTSASLEETRELNFEVADTAGTDGNVLSIERVMRLPGSWHQKDPQRPWQVSIRMLNEQNRYAPEVIRKATQYAHRRGIRTVSGGTGFGVRYDPVFGLPLEGYQEIDSLPSGDRTQKLISHIGKRVSEGYGAEWIEAEVRQMAAEKLPVGDRPISEAAWQQEILPAIGRFQRKLGDTAPTMTAPPPAAGSYNVPGLPRAPTAQPHPPETGAAPPAAPAMSAGLNDAAPMIGEAPTELPNTRLPLEVWEQRYVWVEEGQYVVDTTRPLSTGRYKATDFETAHKNHWIGEALMYGKWLRSPRRRTVRDFMFAPGKGQIFEEDNALYYNTYEPPIDRGLEFDASQVEIFLEHMFYLFPDPDAWWRMMNWVIFTMQNPETRIPWAPVLVSEEGTGKTWIFECIKAMLDNKYTASVEPTELEEKFNSYMSGTLVVCFEEVHTRYKHATIDKFKTLITNSVLELNHKHGRKGQENIFANTFMTTNHDDALAIKPDKDRRRYWIYHIMASILDHARASTLYQWLHTDGPHHLRQWIMAVDQSSWAFNQAPERTRAFDVMARANMSLITRALEESIDDRLGVFQVDFGDERQIEMTVRDWLDQDKLDKTQKRELQHLIRQYTRPLRKLRHNKRVIRLVCWRNMQHWELAPDAIVWKRYKDAQTAALGGEPSSGITAIQGGQS